MNVCFITPEYPHVKIGSSGGIGTSICNLSKELVRTGNGVKIIVYGQPADRIFEESGIIFYLVRNVKLKGFSHFLTSKKVEKLVNRLSEENGIDIAEVPDWGGIGAFLNLKCPMVVRLNGSDTYFSTLDKRPVRYRSRYLEGRAIKRADGLLSVSAFTAKVTSELFGIKKEFTVIPNAVDGLDFRGSSASVTAFDILYFGTLIRKKGLLELPHIFNEVSKQIPQARLILVGNDSSDIHSGSDSTWDLMKSMFSDEAISKVTYSGAVPYVDIGTYIENAAVCVFPTFAEALPVSWIEAMAMEKACVASNIGWAPEIIDDGIDGFLVHPKNHSLFAQKIISLLSNTEQRITVGKNAREKVLSVFDSRPIAKRNVAFYKAIIEKNKSGIVT